MSELPEEILMEILSRLPVKTLLGFKTVCKSWYSIIKSKQFVKKQLNHTHSTLYDQHKDVLGLLIPNSSQGSNRCILYNQNSDGIIYAKEFGTFPFKLLEVCNYCNGLICFNLSGHDDILVWNPSLPMEYKIIPMEYKSSEFWVGMGHDSTTDDYKIVRVPKSRNVKCRDSFVEVFSLKSSSWSKREISKNITYMCQQKQSIYTRNRLHWVAKSIHSIVYFDMVEERLDLVNFPVEYGIVYFDMVEERLDLVNFPVEYGFTQMFNYKDSLAIIDGGNLWVLEDYNGMKSWWSKFELPKFKYLDIKGYNFCYRCFTRDGKILMQPVGHGLRTYDLKDGYVRDVAIEGDDIMYQKNSIAWFYASPYVESLVSPRLFQ